MAECVVWDQRAVRRRALVLLAVADRVKSEGWDDGVAVQLSRAAHELIAMANGGPELYPCLHPNEFASLSRLCPGRNVSPTSSTSRHSTIAPETPMQAPRGGIGRITIAALRSSVGSPRNWRAAPIRTGSRTSSTLTIGTLALPRLISRRRHRHSVGSLLFSLFTISLIRVSSPPHSFLS